MWKIPDSLRREKAPPGEVVLRQVEEEGLVEQAHSSQPSLQAQAVDHTWGCSSDGNWANAANWDLAPIFNADNGVIFNAVDAGNPSTFLGTASTIGSITFNSESTTGKRVWGGDRIPRELRHLADATNILPTIADVVQSVSEE